ncbi:Protein saf4 [Cladophialophora chaetospira]|uniref:Protein saf4 n=1 Tax=Cladophialophora chaetospira TaxID=386627 RepID=A0AA38XJ96_9EURO|nr:Protein saf4 [Cladophialophora chaetospira]
MQGFNMGRYVPPDLEGLVSSNTASGKGHALGSRARKLKSEGILTVRFECPFAIWCTTCTPEQIIGQGVRFNAEKKKVGNYFSSPIWSFRFKHTVCGGWIEVRTDPKSAEYMVTEGGRRRDLGLDKVLEGEVRIGVSEEEKARLEKDGAFGALEKKVEEKSKAEREKERVEQLLGVSERDWSDPYEVSRKLRRGFRVGRRQRHADEKTGEALKEKFGLGLEMLAGTEEDGERAKYIEFGQQEEVLSSNKPMFSGRTDGNLPSKSTSTSRSSTVKLDKKERLGSTLRGNTRIAADPFLREEVVWQPKAKRKRPEEATDMESTKHFVPDSTASKALVGYDSDSS